MLRCERVYALHTRSDKHSPRQAQHLDFVTQFTSNIRHVKGITNTPADTLSRIETNALLDSSPPVINFAASSAGHRPGHHFPAVFIVPEA